MKLFWKLFITMLGFVIAAFMVFGNIIINIPFKSSIERETDRSVEEMHILLYAFTASLDGLPDGYRASGLAVTEITKSLEKNLGNNNNIIVYNEDKEIIYKDYRRHFSDTKNTICIMLEELNKMFFESKFTIALTGSGAMSAAGFLGVNFIQEVVSCKRAVERYIPQTDVVIELGGEDAKIIYFDK